MMQPLQQLRKALPCEANSQRSLFVRSAMNDEPRLNLGELVHNPPIHLFISLVVSTTIMLWIMLGLVFFPICLSIFLRRGFLPLCSQNPKNRGWSYWQWIFSLVSYHCCSHLSFWKRDNMKQKTAQLEQYFADINIRAGIAFGISVIALVLTLILYVLVNK